MLFHLTLSLGRSDTITVESENKNKLLSFFNLVSESVVRNIKEIVFSKDYNINYTKTSYVEEPTYSKVIIQALTENFSDTFVLFNIKRSVKEKDIIDNFKKLLINNEPIIDFVNITFYDKGESPTNYDNMYQVQYKRNSKTYIENFYAKSYKAVLSLAKNLISGEITEIRKFVYTNGKIKADLGNYYKSVNAFLYTDDSYRSLKIPKVKHSISHEQLIENISNTFLINNKFINKDELKLKYS